MKSYSESSLLYVSDSCFKAIILKTKIIFRNLIDTFIKSKDLNIVDFLAGELQYVWKKANVPLCHYISTKILEIYYNATAYVLKAKKMCCKGIGTCL